MKNLKIDNPEYKSFLINSFWGIGWSDPFPDEYSSIEPELCQMLSEDQLIYHESRYYYDSSPMTIFIPSKLIMIKIMRACIGIDRVENLWIYDYSEWNKKI